MIGILSIVSPRYDITLIPKFNITSSINPRIYGINSSDAWSTTSTSSVNNKYFWQSSESVAILNSIPTMSFRYLEFTGDINKGTGGGVQYLFDRSLSYVDEDGITLPSPGIGIAQGSFKSVDRVLSESILADTKEADNFHTRFYSASLNTNNNASHSYVINYYMDFKKDIPQLLNSSSNHIQMIEIGNEQYFLTYLDHYGVDNVSGSGYFFGGWTRTGNIGARTSASIAYNFCSRSLSWLNDNYPDIEVAIPLANPTFQFKIDKYGGNIDVNGIPSNEPRMLDYTYELTQSYNNSTLPNWNIGVIHAYNQVVNARVPTSTNITGSIPTLLQKREDEDGLYFGLRVNYLDMFNNHWFKYYRTWFPEKKFAITEFGRPMDEYSDTMFSAALYYEGWLAMHRINHDYNNQIVCAYAQRFLSSPRILNAIGNRQPQVKGFLQPKLDGSIYTTNTEFQKTVEMEALSLHTPIQKGKFIDSEYYFRPDWSEPYIDKTPQTESYSRDIFYGEVIQSSDGSTNYFMYVNKSDSDLTINWSGTNTYIKGTTTGYINDVNYESTFGITGSIVEEWISGTYTGSQPSTIGYPTITFHSVDNTNTLPARSIGRLSLLQRM